MQLHIHHHRALERNDHVVELILAKLSGIFSRLDGIMVDISKLKTDLENLRAHIAAGGAVTLEQIDAIASTLDEDAPVKDAAPTQEPAAEAPADPPPLTTDKPA